MVTLLPSSATKAITVLAPDVATSLSISAPASVKAGESFVITGLLIRNDTGDPVPNASISLSYNGVSLGSASTGVDGDYMKTVSIGNVGSFTLRADFAGASGLGASSASMRISTGGMNLLGLLLLGGLAYWLLGK